jgi:uncharacterized membrane protein YqaE (UPF0057 family)
MLDNILYLQGRNIFINNNIYNLENIFNENKIYKCYELIKYLNKKTYTNNNEYFILYNGKIIPNNTKIIYISRYENNKNNDNIHNINNIEIIDKQKGGSIIDVFAGIIKIGEFFLKIGDFILWLIKFVLWFIQFILWFFLDLLNPVNLFNDFFQSLMVITVGICRVPFDLFMSLFQIFVNTIGGWMQGFWGWDMSGLTKADKNSPYFKSFNRTKGQKSYLTNTNTVPFSIILGTIICPPMGVFMDMGTSGWINIIVCMLLTLLFYLPGLCYALLIIYS